jgi:hypothetical protein
MTRKDYEALAAALCSSHEQTLRHIGDERNVQRLREEAIARWQLSDAIAAVGKVLAAENPRFDYGKFYEAAMPAVRLTDGDGNLVRVA